MVQNQSSMSLDDELEFYKKECERLWRKKQHYKRQLQTRDMDRMSLPAPATSEHPDQDASANRFSLQPPADMGHVSSQSVDVDHVPFPTPIDVEIAPITSSANGFRLSGPHGAQNPLQADTIGHDGGDFVNAVGDGVPARDVAHQTFPDFSRPMHDRIDELSDEERREIMINLEQSSQPGRSLPSKATAVQHAGSFATVPQRDRARAEGQHADLGPYSSGDNGTLAHEDEHSYSLQRLPSRPRSSPGNEDVELPQWCYDTLLADQVQQQHDSSLALDHLRSNQDPQIIDDSLQPIQVGSAATGPITDGQAELQTNVELYGGSHDDEPYPPADHGRGSAHYQPVGANVLDMTLAATITPANYDHEAFQRQATASTARSGPKEELVKSKRALKEIEDEIKSLAQQGEGILQDLEVDDIPNFPLGVIMAVFGKVKVASSNAKEMKGLMNTMAVYAEGYLMDSERLLEVASVAEACCGAPRRQISSALKHLRDAISELPNDLKNQIRSVEASSDQGDGQDDQDEDEAMGEDGLEVDEDKSEGDEEAEHDESGDDEGGDDEKYDSDETMSDGWQDA